MSRYSLHANFCSMASCFSNTAPHVATSSAVYLTRGMLAPWRKVLAMAASSVRGEGGGGHNAVRSDPQAEGEKSILRQLHVSTGPTHSPPLLSR